MIYAFRSHSTDLLILIPAKDENQAKEIMLMVIKQHKLTNDFYLKKLDAGCLIYHVSPY